MRKAKSRKEIERLLALPWTVELRRNHDGTYFARVVELPGCMTEGADEHEALRNLRRAQTLWLDMEIARGASIPEPKPSRQYSGKFTVRTSPLVHRLAAETARRLGVSLNEFVSEALALAAGASGTTSATSRDGQKKRQVQRRKSRAGGRDATPKARTRGTEWVEKIDASGIPAGRLTAIRASLVGGATTGGVRCGGIE